MGRVPTCKADNGVKKKDDVADHIAARLRRNCRAEEEKRPMLEQEGNDARAGCARLARRAQADNRCTLGGTGREGLAESVFCFLSLCDAVSRRGPLKICDRIVACISRSLRSGSAWRWMYAASDLQDDIGGN